MRILFLDIDGVLNIATSYQPYAGSTPIDPRTVEHFNRLLEEAECKVVLSSAWRYMVHGSAMTLKGFEYLLRTHGIWEGIEIIGVTRPDADRDEPRHLQIIDYLMTAPSLLKWVVVDNMDVSIDNFHKVDDSVGLTSDDVDSIIKLFESQEALRPKDLL